MGDYDITFFMGANSPNGFFSMFDGLYNPYGNWQAYIIKGGPGTGKSGLMRKVASAMEEKGFLVEKIICSSDPDSLDGVIIPELKVCIADGTSPHTIEPKFPGAVEEIVNLGEFWNSDILQDNLQSIRNTAIENSACHKRCMEFLAAVQLLRDDTMKIAQTYTDKSKIRSYASRFAAKEFGVVRGRIGKESKRFLSAVTPKGIYVNTQTILNLCDKLVVIEDDYGAVSSYMLDCLRSYAIACGLEVISCMCPLAPTKKIEHLIIPEISMGIFTSNSIHKADFEASRKISAKRFMDCDALKKHKYTIGFNTRASEELLSEAIGILEQAKQLHDKLESYYINAMDFERVEKKTEEIIEKLDRRASVI
ncbi:MAG: ATPase [Clostridiales bacterium]|nr:ATPase [Clostridiales bacterium]